MARLPYDDLRRVMDLATRATGVSSFAELEAVIAAVGRLAGFEKALFCALRVVGNERRLTHCVNQGFGAGWSTAYLLHGFERVDPVLRHGHRVTGTFDWGAAYRSEGSSATPTFRSTARDFGLHEGVAHSGRSRLSPALGTLLSLARSRGRPDGTERAMRIVDVLGPHLHEAYLRLLLRPPIRAPGPPLSARETEIIAWAREGKTHWEIAAILGISERTVKFHFSRIKAKLDATSVPHAVAKALRMGLVG